MAVEDARAVLVGDAQLVPEALRDEEHCRLALPLEERIGRDGRAHLHGVDALDRNRRLARHTQQVADAGERGVGVLLGIVGKELVRDEGAVGLARDDVGERSTAVDPELPVALHGIILPNWRGAS